MSLENKAVSVLFKEATKELERTHKVYGREEQAPPVQKIIIVGMENAGKSDVANHICGANLFKDGYKE